MLLILCREQLTDYICSDDFEIVDTHTYQSDAEYARGGMGPILTAEYGYKYPNLSLGSNFHPEVPEFGGNSVEVYELERECT